MLKRYHRIFGGIFRAVDACVIGFTWLVSYWLRFFVLPLFDVTKGLPGFDVYASLTPLIMILWTMVFSFMRVYRPRRMLRRTHEVFLILKAHGVSLLFFIALTYMFSEYKYSRAVILYFGTISGFLLILFRLVLRNALRALRRRGRNLRFTLAVGESAAIETIIHRTEKFPELGLRIVGILTHSSSQTKSLQKKPVIGHFEDIPELLQKHHIDWIIISLSKEQYAELDLILKSIKEEAPTIQLVPDIHEYVTLGCEIEDFDGIPMVNLNDSPLTGWSSIVKRVTDFVISLVAVTIFSPFLFIIALLVKVSSRGPIFYKQQRMGLDGKNFNILKFRTMRTDAEDETGAVWAKKGDGRTTRVGAILRKTSLDELPQFLNVILGNMSLVGPRPERPVFVTKFKKQIPYYMLRHKVKAGITGWAQVNGWRGNTSLEKRIEFDLFYIKNWTYVFDIKILFMTIWKGFINKNAY